MLRVHGAKIIQGPPPKEEAETVAPPAEKPAPTSEKAGERLKGKPNS